MERRRRNVFLEKAFDEFAGLEMHFTPASRIGDNFARARVSDHGRRFHILDLKDA